MKRILSRRKRSLEQYVGEGRARLGLALLLGYRALTGRFVSVYVLNDATIVIVSFLQALVIRRSRERCK